MSLQPATSPAVEPEDLIVCPPASRFGLVSKTIQPEIKRVGATQAGEWYLYGTTPDAKDRTPVEALATPRIVDISVVVRAKRASDFGPRPYLDVAMLGETPAVRYILSLPCAYINQATGERITQRSVRSLLGCLLTLDLATTPVKLEPKRGTKATFTNVYLDPDSLQPVRAQQIDAGECALQQAVDACRRKLGLPPQFTMADAAGHPLDPSE